MINRCLTVSSELYFVAFAAYDIKFAWMFLRNYCSFFSDDLKHFPEGDAIELPHLVDPNPLALEYFMHGTMVASLF